MLHYNFEGNLTLQVNIKRGILNVSGDYQPVDPETDGALNPQPAYVEHMGKWMEEGKTARMREWNNWYMPRIQFYDRCILINELSKEEDNGYDRSKIKQNIQL